MSPRDPSKIQLDFPVLTADLIAQLNLIGTVGLLNFADTVVPTFSVGSRGVSALSEPPTFQSAEIFSGTANNPAAGTVIADTGQLAAGTFDILLHMTLAGRMNVAGDLFIIEHRNAANAATLATLLQIVSVGGAVNFVQDAAMPLVGYTIATNERIRAINPGLMLGALAAEIFAHIRPTP